MVAMLGHVHRLLLPFLRMRCQFPGRMALQSAAACHPAYLNNAS